MNRRVPNGMHGGVRGRGLAAPSYSILERKAMIKLVWALMLIYKNPPIQRSNDK